MIHRKFSQIWLKSTYESNDLRKKYILLLSVFFGYLLEEGPSCIERKYLAILIVNFWWSFFLAILTYLKKHWILVSTFKFLI
jgi:hypothetical protein